MAKYVQRAEWPEVLTVTRPVQVMLAKFRTERCAVKQIICETEAEYQACMRELLLLQDLQFDKIVRFFGAVNGDNGRLWMCMEYMPFSDLRKVRVPGRQPASPCQIGCVVQEERSRIGCVVEDQCLLGFSNDRDRETCPAQILCAAGRLSQSTFTNTICCNLLSLVQSVAEELLQKFGVVRTLSI